MKFAHKKYTYIPDRFDKHNWEIVGPNGGAHFHASVDKEDKYDTACGLEFHYFEPPDYMKGAAPSHLKCHLTGGRCWHDGTSLYATRDLWPRIKLYLKAGNHEAVFSCIESEYTSRFEGGG